MQVFTTTSVARFGVGAALELTLDQALPRAHALEPRPQRPADAKKAPAARRAYTTTAPVEFKAGERIGYDGELPKSMAAVLDNGKPPPVEPDERERLRAANREVGTQLQVAGRELAEARLRIDALTAELDAAKPAAELLAAVKAECAAKGFALDALQLPAPPADPKPAPAPKA